MKPQQIIDNINWLYNRIITSDDERIQRDLSDDPFEPYNIEILGNTYSYVNAEVIGQHDYYAGASEEKYCDIKLRLHRDDDIGSTGESKIYEFTVSVEWMLQHMDNLTYYINCDDSIDVEAVMYPLSKSYFKKAQKYPEDSMPRKVYQQVGVNLCTYRDNVDEAVSALKRMVDNADELKLVLLLLLHCQLESKYEGEVHAE